MITYDSAIKKAWDVYLNRDKYAYLYGAKGDVIKGRNDFNTVVNRTPAYFETYPSEKMEEIYQYCLGKTCFDCSGFITYLTGDYTYSALQWAHCTANKSLADGVAGSLLYKPGHIGIDLGYGLFMHFPTELRTAEIGKIKDYNWMYSGKHYKIDYKGSTNV